MQWFDNICTNVLINKSGEIIYSHLGYMKGDEIELVNKVKVLLNET